MLSRRGGRLRRAISVLATAAVVLAAVTVADPAGARPTGPQEGAGTELGDLRAQVVEAWQTGGSEVRAAAERALLGTDADLAGFLDTEWAQRQATDERLAVSHMIAGAHSCAYEIVEVL